MTEKINANDPCICGSRLKFKDCCGRKIKKLRIEHEEKGSPKHIEYYFLMSMKGDRVVRDKKGNLCVWTDRDTCGAYGLRISRFSFSVIGVNKDSLDEFCNKTNCGILHMENQN